MPAREPKPTSRGESGVTLVELVVLVAILSIVAGIGYAALAQRPAQARTTAAAFAGLVAQARALAAINGGAGGASGATIGVVQEGEFSIATLYAYRPILGAAVSPTRAPNTPPLRTATALAIVDGNATLQPPFALFFSASGHVSAQAPYTVGVDAPLANEPDCPAATGIRITFIDGVHDQTHALSCESAQLDLDSAVPIGPQ